MVKIDLFSLSGDCLSTRYEDSKSILFHRSQRKKTVEGENISALFLKLSYAPAVDVVEFAIVVGCRSQGTCHAQLQQYVNGHCQVLLYGQYKF